MLHDEMIDCCINQGLQLSSYTLSKFINKIKYETQIFLTGIFAN